MRLYTVVQLLAVLGGVAAQDLLGAKDETLIIASEDQVTKPFIPLNPLDILDEEIVTLRALIGSYNNKIELLEAKRSTAGGPSSVNAKGKRVKADEVKIQRADSLDYY